jgi:hypothetical protein
MGEVWDHASGRRGNRAAGEVRDRRPGRCVAGEVRGRTVGGRRRTGETTNTNESHSENAKTVLWYQKRLRFESVEREKFVQSMEQNVRKVSQSGGTLDRICGLREEKRKGKKSRKMWEGSGSYPPIVPNGWCGTNPVSVGW